MSEAEPEISEKKDAEQGEATRQQKLIAIQKKLVELVKANGQWGTDHAIAMLNVAANILTIDAIKRGHNLDALEQEAVLLFQGALKHHAEQALRRAKEPPPQYDWSPIAPGKLRCAWPYVYIREDDEPHLQDWQRDCLHEDARQNGLIRYRRSEAPPIVDIDSRLNQLQRAYDTSTTDAESAYHLTAVLNLCTSRPLPDWARTALHNRLLAALPGPDIHDIRDEFLLALREERRLKWKEAKWQASELLQVSSAEGTADAIWESHKVRNRRRKLGRKLWESKVPKRKPASP